MKPDINKSSTYIDVYGSVKCSTNLKATIENIRQGFNAKLFPKLTEDGTSGAYRMRDANKNNIAIFKPIDEEPFAPNNPRGHNGEFGSQTFRPGVLSGESCIREVAAYLIDRGHFSDVPSTTFVEVVHSSLKYVPFTGVEVTSDFYFDTLSTLITPVEETPTAKQPAGKLSKSKLGTSLDNKDSIAMKIAQETQIGMKFGSLQEFCVNEGAIENYGSDRFHTDDVHKIAILDLRIFNMDRNEQNILVKIKTKVDKKDGVKRRIMTLVPIDHGLCIPDNLAICSFDLAWLSWVQAEKPFSKKSLQYIEAIQIMKDI